MQTNSKAAASALASVNARSLAAAPTDPLPDSSDGIAVRAALLHAGLPNATISKMFKYHPWYRNWDVDTKLHHSLKLWLQELGPEGLDAQLLRFPYMLTRTPQDMRDLCLWLLSLGIDADKALRRTPMLASYQLHTLQGKVDAFHAYNLPGLVPFVLRHPQALASSPDIVFQLYSAVAEILDVDPASTDAAIFLNSGKSRAFVQITAAEMKNRMSFFWHCFAANPATVRQALKYCVFNLEPGIMEERAQFLKKMLGLSTAELNKLLKTPQLLNHMSDNLQAHLKSFYELGFSQAHMKAMCLTQPSLLLLDMTSTANVETWSFLTAILKMSVSGLAARPGVFTFSLANRLGPRHAFIVRLLTSGAMCQHMYNAVQPLIYGRQTDADFVETLARHLKTDPGGYTIGFKQLWHERWEYLRQQDDIAITDIGAHQSLLIASVEGVLKPRLVVLRGLAAHQTDFCLIDHLTAAATMSNEDFAGVYDLRS